RGPTAEPTSEISKQAGVAEGTLLTDFKTNDDLMNALLPGDQVRTGAMMLDLPRKESFRRLRHVWYNCVNGGNESQRGGGAHAAGGPSDGVDFEDARGYGGSD